MKSIGRWRRPIINEFFKPSSRCSFSSDQTKNEYLKKAVYPPILNTSEDAVEQRNKEALYEKYRKLHTVEEKLFAVNLPKYYGWKSLILKEGAYPFGFLPFVKHITRTRHFRGNIDLLYKLLEKNRDQCKELLDKIRPDIQQALIFELKGRRWQSDKDDSGTRLSDSDLQNTVAKSIVRQINNIIISSLSSQRDYLFNSITDYEPRVEGFWKVGRFHPSTTEIAERKERNKDITDEEKNSPVEHWIQYIGSTALQVRINDPLRVLDTATLDSAEVITNDNTGENKTLTSRNIEPYFYDPEDAFGLAFGRRFGTNIPGFWPGDKSEFGLLSYHLSGHLLDRPPDFGEEDTLDTIAAQALLSSFSWLLAQASYQGFSTFQELSYPLVNQCIITDGHYFSSHIYQLNTVLLHSDNIITNPRTNVCLSLPYQPLYLDIKDNQFVGWNDEVLESIILFYLNQPEERKNVNLKPHLHPQEKYLCEINDEEKDRRIWLHKQFRHMYSNRPRHRLPYEIYDWERIYKIKFPMRPMDARLRPFELDSNPLEDRKYYQHSHEYIPRDRRTRKKHWTGWRAKFAKTYYPDIEY